MSGLKSLFSGMGADNNDALKYSAPKEPKQRAAKPAPAPVTPSAPSTFTATVVAAPAARAPGPSKIMASAAVRLFKVNPSTGGYDAVEGGGLLGCVMMGTGLTFQILVYNGQKVPQATVAITATFDFTLRDLYMSFSDAAGNQWSLLFDAVDTMTTFVRTVVATVVHCATHNPDTVDASVTIRRALPRAEPADEEDTVLAQGMSAGVYLAAWEVQELADYPGDVLAGAPLKRVQAPDDVLKIKLSPSEEQIGGLSAAIVGLRKGDRLLIGISPQVFYSTTNTTGPEGAIIDATKRAHPGSWLLLEVEVAKIKSEGRKKDKEKGKEAVRNSVPFDTHSEPLSGVSGVSGVHAPYQPDSPVQRLAKRNNSASFDDGPSNNNIYNTNNSNNNNNNNNNNSNEIAARMARVAQGGGGHGGGANSQLAGIMSHQQHNQHNNQRSPGNSSDGRKSYNNSGGSNSNQQNSGGNGNNYNNNNDQYNRNNNNSNSNNRNYNQNSDSYSNDGRSYHNNNSNTNNNNSNNNSNQYQENRLAVIEGQGARSYYDADDDQYNDNNHNNNNYRNPNNPNNNSNYNRAPAPAPVAAPVVVPDTLTSTGLIQLHQSVAAVQQSMLQLHTKLDQVGTQVTNSAALQQQALVTTAGTGSVGGMGGMGGGSAGVGGIPGMQGLNPFMNPLQQQQMQLQMMQQQQQQQMFLAGMGGGLGQQLPQLGGVGSVGGGNGASTTTGATSAQRIKTEEMVSSLQALLGEYERHAASAGSGSGGGAAEVAAAKEEAKVAAKALRATIDKLEEKNDTLQARYDKLMGEKSDLMEKYMEQFQAGSSATNKLYQSQQELEGMRAQQSALQREVETLRAGASSAAAMASGGSSKEKEQEQKNLIAELQHQVMSLQMEVMEHKQASDRARGSAAELISLQAQHAQLTQDLAASRAETAALHDALESAKLATASATAQVAQYEEEERENRLKIAELQAALEAASAGAAGSSVDAALVQQLEGEVGELKSQLAAAEGTAVSLNLALDAVAAKAQETNDSTAATIADLQQQLTAALAAATSSSTTSATGKADAEELKAIMQEVYLKACEVFDPEAPDSGEAQYSTNDIVKRLRGVLKRVTTERNSA